MNTKTETEYNKNLVCESETITYLTQKSFTKRPCRQKIKPNQSHSRSRSIAFKISLQFYTKQ